MGMILMSERFIIEECENYDLEEIRAFIINALNNAKIDAFVSEIFGDTAATKTGGDE
jgi:hypothetical protein